MSESEYFTRRAYKPTTSKPAPPSFRKTRMEGDDYAVEVARGTAVAKAEFGPEIWAASDLDGAKRQV